MERPKTAARAEPQERAKQPKPKTIGFRPTEKDERIIGAVIRDGESTSDVIRRALRMLEHDAWLAQFHADVERLRDEDLSDEPDAW